MKTRKGGSGKREDCPGCNYEKGEKEEKGRYPLVYVKYHDHVLFRNLRPVQIAIAEREAVGWLVYQNETEIVVIADKSSKPIPYEKLDTMMGLRLVRSCVTEIREIRNPVPDNLTSSLDVEVSTQT